MMLRSLLFVPADSERKLYRASDAGADAVILDLEDSVLPARKELARKMAVEYVRSAAQTSAIWVRVNDLSSGELLRDLIALAASSPAGFILPKIRGPEDIQTVSNYLETLEVVNGLPGDSVKILALITETPTAVLRMGHILQSRVSRLTGFGWGAEDLSSALGAGDPRCPNGSWRSVYEYARVQCVLAAHAIGVEAIDTVYVDYKDSAGLQSSCEASRHDGFTGRFAIHPDQVPVINRSFAVSEADKVLARRIVEAFATGAGAVSLDGKMYDIPHFKAACRLLGIGHAP